MSVDTESLAVEIEEPVKESLLSENELELLEEVEEEEAGGTNLDDGDLEYDEAEAEAETGTETAAGSKVEPEDETGVVPGTVAAETRELSPAKEEEDQEEAEVEELDFEEEEPVKAEGEEQEEAKDANTESTGPIETAVILHTDVFPYLLSHLTETALERVVSKYDNVLTLFEDDSVMEMSIKQVLEKIRDTFEDFGNPFDELEEVVLHFRDVDLSVSESCVSAEKFSLGDVVRVITGGSGSGSSAEGVQFVSLEMNTQKSFIKVFDKLRSAGQEGEAEREQKETDQAATIEADEREDEKEELDFELSDNEEPAKGDTERTSPATATEENQSSAKRPIEVEEEAEEAGEVERKKQK